MTQPTQQFKFVEVNYNVSSVFMIPVEWDEEVITVKYNKLYYEEKEISPVVDVLENDFKRPDEHYEITANGDKYDADDYDFDQCLYEKPEREDYIFQIKK